ncbi:hypothetical protein, partial [Burkholderia pseudomallei]|uniref:hypothetical protein n=1 Tax=Burkholderia pseudomallei TaxID=28450 RepID=UPI001E2C802A
MHTDSSTKVISDINDVQPCFDDVLTPAQKLPVKEQRPCDLPPTNRASRSLVKFVFGEEDEHEEALYGTANHRVSEGSRGR